MAGLDSFAVDVNAEEEGLWDSVGDMEFLVARIYNSKWRKLQDKLERSAYGHNYRNPDYEKDNDKQEQIIAKCMAETVILDWKNVTLGGKEIPYSKEKCFEIISDRRYKLLTAALFNIAANQERFKSDLIQEDQKK